MKAMRVMFWKEIMQNKYKCSFDAIMKNFSKESFLCDKSQCICYRVHISYLVDGFLI